MDPHPKDTRTTLQVPLKDGAAADQAVGRAKAYQTNNRYGP
jgi:hypothetical protein